MTLRTGIVFHPWAATRLLLKKIAVTLLPSVQLESGQTVEIAMALTESTAGEVSASVIQISYGHFLRRIDGTQSIRQ